MNRSVAHDAFASLMRVAARAEPEFVSINIGSPALRTRFYAEEAAAAALAAGATIAADIWKLGTERGQSVNVDTRESAAGLVSYQHQKFDDPAKAPPWLSQLDPARTAANGFFKACDGRYIYLHPSFPESTRRLLEVLQCSDEADAVKSKVASMKAFDLEAAIASAGACAGVARTPKEWDDSEQGRIVAGSVVEVTKIGESDPEPFDGGSAPLTGVRVLDLTRVLAGPTCAKTLAQYGADVMVISSPDLPSYPLFVSNTGQGKLAAFVDLKTKDGQEQLRTLTREADVFSQGYRQGRLERLGFGPIDLATLRPGIVVTAINCYGHEGPWRSRPGWEQLAQTVTGMAMVQGGAQGPTLLPAAVNDYTTGYLAAFGTLVALMRRARYGGSYLVRVSLVQTAVWIRALGLAPEAQLASVEPLTPDEIGSFSIRTDTGFGPMTYLRPGVQMSETQPRWLRPVVPLGTHAPRWS